MNRVCRRWVGSLAVAGAGLALLGGESLARERREARDTETVTGKVESTTTAPRGEIDGAVLEDGTVLHWPPHLADRFSDVVKKGDRVKAVGWQERGPEGDERLEVKTLTNVDTRATAENDGPGPRERRRGPPPPPRPRGRARTIEATVERLTTAPKGEIDGAVLDDGTTLHWPPHLENQFARLIDKGDRVKAVGFEETTKRGDEHFEVQSLTNLETNESFENDEVGPPPPEDRPGPRREPASRSERIRQLKREVERLEREIERLEQER
ncbi:MAG TPA: hypothetical protein VG826_29805 [Pirellulales bacterium]|nr:hypothetical protein [Pirellulales bacterium]